MFHKSVLFGSLILSCSGFAQSLYETKKGGVVDLNKLSPSQRQRVFEVDLQRFEQLKNIADRDLLDQHFAEEAKKTKKTIEEAEAAFSTVAEPSDKEAQTFFNSNKDKIPPNYTFDQVKGELKKVIQGQKQQEKLSQLLGKLKKETGFKFLLEEPKSPVVSINTDGFPRKGKSGAKVQVVEFADYQCPHCKHVFDAMNSVFSSYKEKIEFVFIDFPINRSGISRVVAEAAFCALEQGKYWEFHELAFKNQANLTNEKPAEFAKTLGLDEAKFKECAASAKAKTFVSKGKSEGERIGISGTPAVYINGTRYMGAHEDKALRSALDSALKG